MKSTAKRRSERLQCKSKLALAKKECTKNVDISVNDENNSSFKQGNSKSTENTAKKFKKQKTRKRKVSISSDDTVDSNISEDEWEEVDFAEPTNYEAHCDGTVEVTIRGAKPIETEESKWAKFIRQQVNRKIRERQINCHKMHLLCYIAHLRIWTRALIQHETLTSLCLSLIPEGYITAAKHEFDVAIAERFMKWFRSAFQFTEKKFISKNGLCNSQIKRLEDLIGERAYEDDKDLASLLFLCLLSLKQCTRLCLSCQPITQKLTMNMLRSEHTETFVKKNIDNNDNSAIWEKKLYEVTKKIKIKADDCSDHSDVKKCQVRKRANIKKLKGNIENNSDQIASTSKKNMASERNYWVEYWDRTNARWICMDPWYGFVDMPESLEANATASMHYVVCIDNSKFYAMNMGMRDVTARYASKFLSAEIRRLRVDSSWWTDTLKIYRSKNRKRERVEDVEMHNELLSKPKPATVAEYKNHPLYVLKKDILKYEAIYPEDQAPIGRIRGIDIYPRSSVFHLDGALNWIKQARMVKAGEKPYKVVKGRTNPRVVSQLRESRSLELFGYWQTEPYVPPKVVNGRIPRNEFGNLYVYKSSMVPEGCVHLRLSGLTAISRQLDIDCVPAVVGWEFHKGGNHPIIEGCVILKKHERILREAWKEFYEKKEIAAKKRQTERALKNWRRLVKGMLTMKKVRAKFLVVNHRSMQVDEKLEKKEDEIAAVDDTALSWPQTIFNFPDSSDSWQLRLTPKEAAAKIVVAIIGLAIGAYAVASVYKPLQMEHKSDLPAIYFVSICRDFRTNWICARVNYCATIKGNMMNVSNKLSTKKTNEDLTDVDDGGGYRDHSPSDSLFKRTFKFYKRHDVVPNFSEVLDLRSSLSSHGVVCSKFEPVVAPSDIISIKLGFRPVSKWTVSTIAHRPGMIMLNDIFEPVSHLQWIKRSLFVYAEPPGFTNVGLKVPKVRNVFKEYGKQLRWSTLGLHYDWATKIYPLEGESLPEELVSLSDVLSQALGIGPMYADAAIINFYSRKSTLAPHVDRSERKLSSPLISLSFGQTAIYLAGGTNLDDPIDAFYIRSGDVLVVYGPQRLIYHAVPRIIQDKQFEDKDQPEEIVKYANENRINITLRQVDEHK
uniref:Fe2OG dioxygenase domain-containing protein n=1 Tax=Onchocerca volvulus TaxID=6282 RepID=A0A8R1XPM6_ONCVO